MYIMDACVVQYLYIWHLYEQIMACVALNKFNYTCYRPKRLKNLITFRMGAYVGLERVQKKTQYAQVFPLSIVKEIDL